MSEQDVFEALKYRIEVDEYGTQRYYNAAGQMHRDNGPAVLTAFETKIWMQNGLKHRTDGPAVIRAGGGKEWWQNGLLHRTDGPAAEWAGGRKDWYINGVELTEDEFNQAVNVKQYE